MLFFKLDFVVVVDTFVSQDLLFAFTVGTSVMFVSGLILLYMIH